MFFILGICIALFLEFLLLIKRNKSRADIVLAVWLLLMVIHQALYYHLISGQSFDYPHMLGILLPLPVLHGVLLYFYILEVTGKGKIKTEIRLLHFIPALVLTLLAIPFFMLPAEQKVFVFQNDGIGFEWYLFIHQSLMLICGFAYSIWTLILIHKHQKDIQSSFSNTDKKELNWLRYLSIGLGIIWLLAIPFDEIVIFSSIVVFVLFIGIFGINQMTIFNTESDKQSTIEDKRSEKVQHNAGHGEKKRYAKSGLNEEMAEQIYSQLNQIMPKEALFKKDDLTLSSLAKHLDVHPNHLSQVINEKEEKNFYNYINSLRIKEFIRLASLPENKKYTLITLAYDCGFNSKSTFNKHFKAYTTKTPSDYFKEQKTAV